MNFNQAIIDFVEGDISLEDVDKLIREMGSNDALRSKFTTLMYVSDTIKKSVDTFSPPSYVTNEIYRKLGYSIPPVEVSMDENRFRRKRSLMGYLFTAILAAAIAIALMMLFYHPGAMNRNTETAKGTQNVNAGTSGQVPTITSKENSSSEIKAVRHRTKTPVFEDVAEYEQKQASGINDEYLMPSQADYVSYNGIASANIPELHYFPGAKPEFKPFIFDNRKLLGLSIGLSSMATWDIPKGQIPSKYYAPFNNNSLSLNYDLSDNWKIGLEGRQETFYNQYRGTDTDGKVYTFLQQSNFNSFGGKVMYYPLDKGLYNPYAGVVLSGNPAGFIARPFAGLEYQPYPDIAFLIGCEYSYFWFNHQGSLFHTKKIAVNYGISIKI